MAKSIDSITFNSARSGKVSLQEFLDAINARLDDYYEKTGNGRGYKRLIAEPGSKYIKIVEEVPQRSVYCFLDYDGNIYKAATWRAPAKHVRGNVFEDNFSWGRALNPYGAAYLR